MTHSIHPLPLIDRIEQLNPIVALLENRHAPVEELLARAYLPQQIDSGMGQFVSARSALRFLAIAAHDLGIDDLGWHSAIGSDITRLGAWGESVSRCQTLRESQRVSRRTPRAHNGEYRACPSGCPR